MLLVTDLQVKITLNIISRYIKLENYQYNTKLSQSYLIQINAPPRGEAIIRRGRLFDEGVY